MFVARLETNRQVCGRCSVIRTYTVEQAIEIIGAPSERWLMEQLRSGRFPGRRVGRHWRMTEQDIEDALDLCRNEYPEADRQVSPLVIGLTPRSKRRRGGAGVEVGVTASGAATAGRMP